MQSSENSELWRVRAEALLPVLQAAIEITHSPNFAISKNGAVLIPRKEYEALHQAVEAFRLAAGQEQE